MQRHRRLSWANRGALPAALCLLTWLLLAASVSAQGNEPLPVHNAENYSLTPHLQFAASVPAHFGAPLIYHSYRQPRAGETPRYVQWQPAAEFRRPLFTNKNWWFAASLITGEQVSENFVLAINSARVYDAEVFVYRKGALQHSYAIGSQLPFDARPLATRYYALPVELAPHSRYDLLIRASGMPHLVYQNLELWPRESYFAHGQPETGFQWFYFGIMSVICLAAFGLSVFLRSRGFLYYGLFVFFSTFFFFITEGLAFQYLWPESSWLASRAHLVVVVFAVATRILFIDELLNMRAAVPVVHRINMLLVVLTLLTGLAPLLASMQYAFNIPFLAMFMSVPSHLLLFGAACWLWRQGNSEAGWYALLWLFYALMHLVPIALGGITIDPYHYAQLGDGLLALGLFGILLRRIAKLMHDERQARAESQAKSDFLARMSHELRTPMTGVIGTADLLAETPLNRSQRHNLQLIQKCGHALLAVINDVLDSSKIAAGKIDLHIRPTRVDVLVNDCVDIFATKAGEKELTFLADVEDDVPACIECDAAHIRQILINLLSNAFKFTEAGAVELHIGLAAGQPRTLEISVRDSGIGIDPAVQKKLFRPFQQGDTSIAQRYGGTGLGLVICKQLAELMGGDIQLRSTVGVGTTFTLSLPCIEAPAETQQTTDHPLSGQRALLSIPNVSYRVYCERRLRGWGADLTVLEAPEQLPLSIDQDTYDLLVIDVGNDELLVKKLSRWYSQQVKRFPNTLVLQHQLSENGKRILAELPVFLEIERPIFIRSLLQPLQSMLELGRARSDEAGPAEPAPGARGQRLNILLAEDNEVNQTVFRGMVANLGHQLTVADNGAQALERYKESLRGRRSFYDLVLMDCEMPEVDGYEATRQIRSLEREQRLVPSLIIAVTANASSEHMRKCHECGMDDVMTKPINLATLRSRLEEVTERLEKRG